MSASKEEFKDDVVEQDEAAASRLGKEAKIGVAVIALLVVVLGAVLTMRLMRPGDEENPIAAKEPDAGKKKPEGPRALDMLGKDERRKSFGGGPTVVPPAPKSPTKSPSADELWKTVSDESASKPRRRFDGAPALGGPPPFPPELAKADPTERRHRNGPDSRVNMDLTDAKRPHGDEGAMALIVSDDLPPRSAQLPRDRRDRDGFASVESMPEPPAHRQGSRYGDAAAPPRGSSSYSIGEGPSSRSVGQYDIEDRRDISGRGRPGEPRRPSRPSPADVAMPRDDGKYEVQPNDSYWSISERLYGTGAYFKALAEHNRGRKADDRLKPGELIAAPTVAELEKAHPDLCPRPERREALQSQGQSRVSTVSGRGQGRGGRTYTVAEGDTLFNIARYELGKASRWAEIYEMNRDVLGRDINYLTPGTRLVLPDREKSDVIAQPPANGFLR